ncbi:MAG: FAD-binding monooxygenase, PheA/TfdB family [Akkermansiaceae bacterium]|nr:FAD-binding monooxygenase, PheA/TfdB family [Akkermansiaceae bacterium]
MMSDSPVVIVGAGPAGLVLAVDLARRGIPLRIIEKAAAPSEASRAKGLQPRTLEILDDLGIIAPVLAGGARFPHWRSYAGETLLWERSIWELLGREEPVASEETPFPETWMIPQSRTERILRERLAGYGVQIEYGAEFTGCRQDGDGVVVTMNTAAGPTQARCRFLVGADGGRSAVRKALAIPFRGETRDDERFLIADVEAADLDRRYWHNWSIQGDPVQRISMCPLPGTSYFQFVAPLAADIPAPEATLETLQQLLDARAGAASVPLANPTWITLHRTNLRLAERYRCGAVFLTGDAAHSPPQGAGQGLNISVQDAFNLGWKIAAVLRGAPEGLLDSYERERRPFAAGKLGVLPEMLRAAGLDDEDEAERRQAEIANDLFHLQLHYRDSPAVREARAEPSGPRAGDRAPDARVSDASGAIRRVFDLCRGPHFTLLAFSPESADLCGEIASSWSVDIHVHLAHRPATGGGFLHEIYGVAAGSTTILLIRPDGYIGLAADTDLRKELHGYFSQVAAPRP